MRSSDFFISWNAPIIPRTSLAGIPLHVSSDTLDMVLSRYLVDKDSLLYRFDGSPDLRLIYSGIDEYGNGGYSFTVFDNELVNELKRGVPALSVSVKGGKVFAVKVYDFSFPGEFAQKLIYKGVLSEGIGLGSLVSDILSFSSLEFDEAEEWFYTDCDYGVLELTGWGVPIEDQPSQIVTAICVIPGF